MRRGISACGDAIAERGNGECGCYEGVGGDIITECSNGECGCGDVGGREEAEAAIQSPSGLTANKDGKHKQKRRKTAELGKKRR